MRALGVDPGLTATGFGVVEEEGGYRALAAGTVRPKQKLPLPERLGQIRAELLAVVEAWQPEVVAVEEVYLARNAPSAMLTAQVVGVVKLVASGRRLRAYAPSEVKKWICGTGAAPKEQMMGMTRSLLGLSGQKLSNHAADALALALCALLEGLEVRP